jgi:hypothetical protein
MRAGLEHISLGMAPNVAVGTDNWRCEERQTDIKSTGTPILQDRPCNGQSSSGSESNICISIARCLNQGTV